MGVTFGGHESMIPAVTLYEHREKMRAIILGKFPGIGEENTRIRETLIEMLGLDEEIEGAEVQMGIGDLADYDYEEMDQASA